MSAVRLERVCVEYGASRVLEPIDLAVDAGCFCTLVGPSGCGKSTLLRLLLGQERPTRGRILVDEAPIPDEPSPGRGIVFQRYSVFPHLTVAENLILAQELRAAPRLGRLFGARRRAAFAAVEEMLARIGLAAARALYPAQLSGGMQQRLALAQAILDRPRVLLLDEPFGALDPGIRRDMQRLLLELWREIGMTVFMVTHDIKEAFDLGTRLIALDKIRHDPQAPGAYGAVVTYDLPLRPPAAAAPNRRSRESGSPEPPAQAPAEHQPAPNHPGGAP